MGWLFPHVSPGALYAKTDKPLLEQWCHNKFAVEFLRKVADDSFVEKPLLTREHEGLYADGNRDFEGKYRLRFSPYIFEPTFTDGFVYGYAGDGTVDTPEALSRPVRKDRDKQKAGEP